MPAESRSYRSRVRKERASKRKRRASEYDTDTELLFPIWDSVPEMKRFLFRILRVIIDVVIRVLGRGGS